MPGTSPYYGLVRPQNIGSVPLLGAVDETLDGALLAAGDKNALAGLDYSDSSSYSLPSRD
eukprot:4914957-Pleurochrysis_carterae.AAC.1